MEITAIESTVRDIPDFPKEGIVFKDITPVLACPKTFRATVEKMCAPYQDAKIDKIVALDARGFIFGSAMAYELNAGITPVRKAGKLPYDTKSYSYDLEYGSATLEIHTDAIEAGEYVLIIDDLLATGGTAEAAIELVEQQGANIVSVDFFMELSFLNGRDKLKGHPVKSLITI